MFKQIVRLPSFFPFIRIEQVNPKRSLHGVDPDPNKVSYLALFALKGRKEGVK